MKKGDIVLARFPFTDLSSEKLRPALVSVPENRNNDVVLAFITTQMDEEDVCDLLVSSKNPDFKKTGLKKDSLIKLNKLITLNKSIILGKIGQLSQKQIEETDKNLKQLLKI